ncbi:SgcJ/EcaC family oxidoreductase [Glycomyces sp. TRM65418]|uniref:SgcJ/EcaC family oxidoreductase n=1 Tax=Glycomyces sp. TRM65418 TaxID=2867006 RepID=UPI001CE699C8|nr:SgcJ/EcaC family oxidoreductase [Glycomyces sp. TRM65418]MCC3763802.1 SgcJ/EcaC family oxidoreductase [Glycomyces sp. TRM65418]QZD53510.1 SgcJ/EcaC family oxidoreductase [Glycomyces sp. TRM65418]
MGTETAERAAVEHLVAEYQRHQSDPERFLALHAETTVVVNIAGRRVLGRAQLAEAMAAALASPLAKVRTALEIEDVRYPRPDIALVSAVKRVYDERDEQGGLPTTGAYTMLLVKEDGEWRVTLAQTTPRPAA